MRQTCEHLEIEILKSVVGKDHVHLVVSALPNWSVSNIMKMIKGRSSTKLFQVFPQLKKDIGVNIFGQEDILCNGRGAYRTNDQ